MSRFVKIRKDGTVKFRDGARLEMYYSTKENPMIMVRVNGRWLWTCEPVPAHDCFDDAANARDLLDGRMSEV